jgi:trans-aconitate 2-methyltransferase
MFLLCSSNWSDQYDMTHEFDGKKYETASDHQKEWGARLIETLCLNGTERVLDLGCGDGSITAQIAQLLPEGEVLGVDASEGMIAAAVPKRQHNLNFCKLDINCMNFAEQFDVVFSNAALHWVKDHKRLLRNVRHSLRPGGFLRFNFAGKGNCSYFFSVIKEAIAQQAFRSFFTEFEWPWYMPDHSEYHVLAKSSGFQDVQVWNENADRYFPDEKAMIRWIDQPSLVPFLAYVNEQKKDAFRDFVVHRMCEETKQKDGRCFETFRRINVSATKRK